MPSNHECAKLEWLESINKDPIKQRDFIASLLDHAEEDGMSDEDRDECLDGLKLLELEETGGSYE